MERFWSKVNKTPTCWLWTGAKSPSGYGKFRGDRGTVLAHRWSWEKANGRTTELPLDHLCRTPSCVRPDHLEAVPIRINTLRGVLPARNAERAALVTHCPYGHEYTAENTYRDSSNMRHCRACGRRRSREYQQRKAALALARGEGA